jgi:hypothetical protein
VCPPLTALPCPFHLSYVNQQFQFASGDQENSFFFAIDEKPVIDDMKNAETLNSLTTNFY